MTDDYIKREDAERMVAGMKSADGLSAVKALGVIPSSDVAPVVRCKDCKYWDEHSQYGYDDEHGTYGNYCMIWTPDDDFYAVETPEDGFCYEGERKDDDGHR